MTTPQSFMQIWAALPPGAAAAIEQQWAGLAAGALPCGAAVVATSGQILSSGRNHVYDPAGAIETRRYAPLQHTRLAHAELNALAGVSSSIDHTPLTLWTTHHPCMMCAAALAFVGIGTVRFIADDLSDDSPAAAIVASRGKLPYEPFAHPLWWTICNLLFLYTSAVQQGAQAGNLQMNRERYPRLVRLTLDLANADSLGLAARSGVALVPALMPYYPALVQLAEDMEC